LLALSGGQICGEVGSRPDALLEAMKSLLRRVRGAEASTSSDVGPRKGVGGGFPIGLGRMTGVALSAQRQIGFEPCSQAADCASGSSVAPDELRTTQMSASTRPATFKN